MKNNLAKKIVKRAYGHLHNTIYDHRYHAWLRRYGKDDSISKKDSSDENAPLISIVVPTYNTNEKHFHEMIDSVFSQTYLKWELVLVDDNSPNPRVRELIKEYAGRDTRVKYKFLTENLGISGATNEAIALSQGEYIALFDHDDLLQKGALLEVADAVMKAGYDFIYTDEDKYSEGKRGRHQPFFKPAWNSDLLRSVNYITHFAVIRKSLLDEVGYEDGDFDGAQDWELFLRCTRNLSADKIHHIPKVLYSWRVHPGSTAHDAGSKPYVFKAQQRALEKDLDARGVIDATIVVDKLYQSQWMLEWSPSDMSKVMVVVSPLVTNAIPDIRSNTSYQNYELSIVEDERWSDLITSTDADYLVFVTGQTNIKSIDWMHVMLGDARRSDIGFVQSKLPESRMLTQLSRLLGPDQHKLIVDMTTRDISKHLYSTVRYNVPSIDGGVLMIETKKLRHVVHNSRSLPAWSATLHEMGYRNLYNPYVEVLK